jgi:hypothetical protein
MSRRSTASLNTPFNLAKETIIMAFTVAKAVRKKSQMKKYGGRSVGR